MRWVERGTLAAGLLLCGCAIADSPSYGKVETFQPGKKYNCVPTADHKGWDCSESGKASAPQGETQAQAPAATAPAPAAAQQQQQTKSSALPSYLTNAAAGGGRPAAVAAATAAAPSATSIAENKPSPAQTAPEPAKAEPMREPVAAPAQSVVKTPPPAPTPLPAEARPDTPKTPPPVQASARNAQPASSDFLALSGEQFVIELAHADGDAALAQPAVPHGNVYKLHLRQNGNDHWLLLWGVFDSVESARAAREEIANTGLTPGWPRRIGPLQAEARRSGE